MSDVLVRLTCPHCGADCDMVNGVVQSTRTRGVAVLQCSECEWEWELNVVLRALGSDTMRPTPGTAERRRLKDPYRDYSEITLRTNEARAALA